MYSSPVIDRIKAREEYLQKLQEIDEAEYKSRALDIPYFSPTKRYYSPPPKKFSSPYLDYLEETIERPLPLHSPAYYEYLREESRRETERALERSREIRLEAELALLRSPPRTYYSPTKGRYVYY